MTAGQLILLLEEYPPATEVVMMTDSEGNGVNELDTVEPGFYHEEDRELYSPDEDLEDLPKDCRKVLVIWP
jgi:hypothetical protein